MPTHLFSIVVLFSFLPLLILLLILVLILFSIFSHFFSLSAFSPLSSPPPPPHTLTGATVRPRQTLLFSATFSKEVREVAAITLRKGYTIIDTVGEEVEQTHSHVTQEMMSVPVGTHLSNALYFLHFIFPLPMSSLISSMLILISCLIFCNLPFSSLVFYSLHGLFSTAFPFHLIHEDCLSIFLYSDSSLYLSLNSPRRLLISHLFGSHPHMI